MGLGFFFFSPNVLRALIDLLVLKPFLNSWNEPLVAPWYYSLCLLLGLIRSEVFGALFSFLGFDTSIMSLYTIHFKTFHLFNALE